MYSWLKKIATTCFGPVRLYARMNNNEGDSVLGDPYLWFKDLEKHFYGEFSFAVVQANAVIEDHSQVETGQNATFVGVYDGHGGPEASIFVRDHLFLHLMRLARENEAITEENLMNAFAATEDEFLDHVRMTVEVKPLIAAVGSCCLVAVIWKGTLYIANLGDSRAVMGYLDRSNKIKAEQLTKDHNASIKEVRQELKLLHPEDSHIVVMKNGAWRVKGIIQVTRAIGDAYLKKPEFAFDSSVPRFHLPAPLKNPVLRSDPSIYTRALGATDRFLIFASDGLWEHLTNQEAVKIVSKNPRAGIARRLVETALTKAARKDKKIKKYDELKRMLRKGVRRTVHDDITVVVLFLDDGLLEREETPGPGPGLSVQGGIDDIGPSRFNILQDPEANPESVG